MKKFAIILSGCGQHDGSETHEVILTLLSISQETCTWEAFAPEGFQTKVVDHLSGESEKESRSIIKESARLVRGNIKPLSEAKTSDFDALIFPGGIGAVNILCDWFEKQNNFDFHPEVEDIIKIAKEKKKPMGFICIAPVMITKIYKNAKLTIGNDNKIASQIEKNGCKHVECKADEVIIDEYNKIVSTPANMVANNISEVYIGINKMVKELIKLSS